MVYRRMEDLSKEIHRANIRACKELVIREMQERFLNSIDPEQPFVQQPYGEKISDKFLKGIVDDFYTSQSHIIFPQPKRIDIYDTFRYLDCFLDVVNAFEPSLELNGAVIIEHELQSDFPLDERIHGINVGHVVESDEGFDYKGEVVYEFTPKSSDPVVTSSIPLYLPMDLTLQTFIVLGDNYESLDNRVKEYFGLE